MNKLLPTLASAALLLGGCNSTYVNPQKMTMVNGEYQFPPMPIIQQKPFVWDESKSEAMNVITMANPAGIGNGLRDLEDGTQASINNHGILTGLVDATLGLVDGGIVGAAQSEGLRSGVNDLVEFKPAIVEIVEPELVVNDGQIDYLMVRELITEKVHSAVEKAHPDIQWGGVYALYDGSERFDMSLVITSEKECKAERIKATGDEDAEAFLVRDFSSIFVDSNEGITQSCSFGFKLSSTGVTKTGKVVVVAEMKSGISFVQDIIDNYDGYVVVPDEFYFNRHWKERKDFVFVSKNGEQLLLQKP